MTIAPPVKTKERILLAALEIFNEKGASATTTNHIAKAMGISPGNLYYHYRNKEEIIRSIWDDLSGRMDVIWKRLASDTPENDLAEFFVTLFTLFYRYRFFWIELPVILDRDPELSKIYRKRTQGILQHYSTVMDLWVEKGMMEAAKVEGDKEYLLENTWFIGQFWINYCYINYGHVTPANMQEGLLRVFHILKAYMRPKSIEIISARVRELTAFLVEPTI